QGERTVNADALHGGVGERTAPDGQVQEPGQLQVVDVCPAPGQQPRIVAAPNPRPEGARTHGAASSGASNWRRTSASQKLASIEVRATSRTTGMSQLYALALARYSATRSVRIN